MNTATLPKHFQFQIHELPLKLLQYSRDFQAGHWEIRLHPQNTVLYLAIVQGQVVFAGPQRLGWPALLKGLQRYIPQLRTTAAREAIALLEVKACAEQKLLGQRLRQLEVAMEISYETIVEALRLQILTIVEQLWNSTGEANFILDVGLGKHSPIAGLSFERLNNQIEARQQNWDTLKTLIPTMHAIPILNKAALEKAALSSAQKKQIETLTGFGKSLNSIAQITAKDTLNTAKIFANLVQSGLVSLKFPAGFTQTETSKLEIFIVDDSTVFLQQFQSLVSSWGYQITVCSTSETAIETMVAVQPDLIFLDINMPGLSGFELIKAVRREAQLAEKNLVLLTAENSLTNQWRAKWGNCKFLSKPRTMEEIQTFQLELKQLLQEVTTPSECSEVNDDLSCK
jgi:CheY-like chemotaxis protein